MMGELVLVTGASGYIATHLVKQLLQEGYRVRGTVRSLKDETKTKSLFDLADSSTKANLELVEADLMDADCWPKVVEGCDYVMHTASPFPAENPSDEDKLIQPAVNGTVSVLQACGPGVKRVVLTSSVAAISAGHQNPPNGTAFTEEDWTLTDKVSMVYEKSKTLAERAAWDYMENRSETQTFDLAVVNPSLVLGPTLCGGTATSTSLEIAKRIMMKEMPLLPRLSFSVVDVRDVATTHIRAMKIPEAGNHRHILSGHNLWLKEMALMIESEFKPLGYSIPTSYAPYGLLWILGRFDASVKMILPAVGHEEKFENKRMVDILGVTPRPISETIIDMCYSLVETGKVKKTQKYVSAQTKGTNL